MDAIAAIAAHLTSGDLSLKSSMRSSVASAAAAPIRPNDTAAALRILVTGLPNLSTNGSTVVRPSAASVTVAALTAATLCDCNEVTLCIFDAAAGPNCCNACNAPKTTSKSGLFNKLEMASMCGSAAGEPMRPSA